MWIDTHCHLDAPEFAGRQAQLAAAASKEQVSCIVIPAIAAFDFKTVAELSAQHPNCVYALGIHPMYVAQSAEEDLQTLRKAVEVAINDPKFVAIGEIGLDFFVEELKDGPLRDKQEHFYLEQLRIAKEFDLPVLLHVRRSQDLILKYLRRVRVKGGIAHAFNGSFQQAQAFMELGFKFGFGGAMTFPRALQIRRLATELPLESIVLETDAPDIPPEWLDGDANSPDQIPRIGEVLATLRGMSVRDVAMVTSVNARTVLPRLP
jgi:TatD DNase family protein